MSDTLQLFREKFNAFLIHLFVSVLILFIVFLLVYFVLYPYPLLTATGGKEILLIMVMIDIVLGPLLTFIVYRKYKKTLKFDLAIIGLIQLIALVYGLYSMVLAKPCWIVFNQNKFELIQCSQIVGDIGKSDYQLALFERPIFIAVMLSQNPKLKSEQVFDEVLSGISLAQRPENYVDLSKVTEKIQEQAQSVMLLQQYNDVQQVDRILSKYPQATSFVPLKANAVDMTVLINKDKGEVVKIVDLRPWK
ncbi:MULTISPECIES: TfpX/TfpZ family type IV pilin accessory protein [Acinetobacter]|uniref:TfpX/TfpZ family type IV pilin accessory protein n=1 Tax=Acinetobacter TaxID=469 RepID=UPI00143A8860|nr:MULTISPECIES: TfpX/TfpZ family type IV pilin accessory protein [Acinetobacter]MDD0803743.1 TfpX/TfpZ family type IV pilin accessory protein [Acinetobacter sp. Gutcm_16]NKG37290.1 type IV pilin accessory protein [Acinetobacter johnsonii]